MEQGAPYTSPVSVDELATLEPTWHRLELTRGRLVEEPPAGRRHGTIAMTVGSALYNYARATGRGRVFACDTGFILARDPDTVRAPDVAFVNLARCADALSSDAMFDGPPDLAVEVLSPHDRRNGIKQQLEDYRMANTPVIWLVDPHARRVKVVAGAVELLLLHGETLTSPGLLPGFALPVAHIFE